MRHRIIVALLATLALLAPTVASAPSASAHYCDARCNVIWNYSNNGTGLWIYNQWDGNIGHVAWLLQDGRTTQQSPLYQPDVDGFYMADTWCGDVYQSNDGRTWGYYGLVAGWQGGRYFATTYWLYTEMTNQRRCVSLPHP